MQLYPVIGIDIGVCHRFINDDVSRSSDMTGVVGTGGAISNAAGPPALTVFPGVRVGVGRVIDVQSKAAAVCDVVPAILEAEVVNYLAGGILQLNPFAGVIQSAGVRAHNSSGGTILRGKFRQVFCNDDIASGSKGYIRESKVDSIGEFDQIQVNCGAAVYVFQLDEFSVGVVYRVAGVLRMVHHLGNSQVICDGADSKGSLVKSAPVITCVPDSGFNLNAFI